MIANLYPESIHLVVKKAPASRLVADLKGKRVALDEPGSGTLINARMVLAAYGVKEATSNPVHQAQPGRRQTERRCAWTPFLRRQGSGGQLPSPNWPPVVRASSWWRWAGLRRWLLRSQPFRRGHHRRQHLQRTCRVQTLAVGRSG